MRQLYFFLFFGISLFLPNYNLLSTESEEGTGTLIVTYKTDSKGERLDRIRIWLKDQQGQKQAFYPKGKAFVDDPKEPSRMIVIKTLPPGQYSLQFLVPNTDRYFQDTPKREVVISAGEIVKIDQKIKPLEKNREETHSHIAAQPRLEHYEEVKIPSTETFDEALVVNEELPQAVQNSESNKGFGKLIVSFDMQSVSNQEIHFRLVDSNGRMTIHPNDDMDIEIPLKSGNMIMVPKVPAGLYTLEFFSGNETAKSLCSLTGVRIERDETKSIHESLPCLKNNLEMPSTKESPKNVSFHEGDLELSVAANIPTAVFLLENEDKTSSWKGKGRVHNFRNLSPGDYYLSFQSSDPFFVSPEPIIIELSEGLDASVETTYDTLGRLKILSNIKNAEAEITSALDSKPYASVQIHDGEAIAYLPEGQYQVVFKTYESAHLLPAPINVEIRSLQTKEVNAYFERIRNNTKAN